MLAHHVDRPRSGPLLRGRERVVVNLRRMQAHHHVFPRKRFLASKRPAVVRHHANHDGRTCDLKDLKDLTDITDIRT
jgi:hypothetical protein